jgi:hypothetical protein
MSLLTYHIDHVADFGVVSVFVRVVAALQWSVKAYNITTPD